MYKKSEHKPCIKFRTFPVDSGRKLETPATVAHLAGRSLDNFQFSNLVVSEKVGVFGGLWALSRPLLFSLGLSFTESCTDRYSYQFKNNYFAEM